MSMQTLITRLGGVPCQSNLQAALYDQILGYLDQDFDENLFRVRFSPELVDDWRLDNYMTDRITNTTYSIIGLPIAIALSGLVPMASGVWQDVGFYLDPIADANGEHRLYVRDEDAMKGNRWCHFTDMDAAASCLLGLLDESPLPFPDNPDDAWERGPQSGSYILESYLDYGLGCFEGGFNVFDEESRLDTEDRQPGWQRRLCLAVFHHIRQHRAMPLIDRQVLDERHQHFLRYFDWYVERLNRA